MATSRRRFLAAIAGALVVPKSPPAARKPVAFILDLDTMQLTRALHGVQERFVLTRGNWEKIELTIRPNFIRYEADEGEVAAPPGLPYS